ncbi:hypothetical protein CN383_10590 [Priestia megaterium]|nr:hypothetical protein CN383_10590 [Priestia megaterium]
MVFKDVDDSRIKAIIHKTKPPKLFKLFTTETEIYKDKEVDLHEENDFNEVCNDHFIIDEY